MRFMKWHLFLLPLLVGVGSFLIFLLFQATGIYGGDSGDLVTAAFTFGIPHPPGYPLYTLLGWLLTRLPLFTPAWRVGIASSIPHALTLALLFLIVRRLTNDAVAATFSCIVLAGNYLFFLYSITPEVFALLNFFIVLLYYLLLGWGQTGRPRYLYLASGIFGLTLGHHQLILFLVPSVAYFIWKQKKSFKVKKNTLQQISYVNLLGLFFLGLTPYLYVLAAARGASIINWDRPTNLARFFHLILRNDYGTFVANNTYGVLLTNRMLQWVAYGKFIIVDFTVIGIITALCGLYWLYRHHKVIGYWLFLSIVSIGPGFFFYAGYPLANNFTLGTYERFLLPSYILVSILIGCGVYQLKNMIYNVCRWFANQTHARRISLLVIIVLFVYPVVIAYMTLWRFWGIRWDRTADNLGSDILTTAPNRSLILLNRDTPLFITQYVRYGLGVRPGTIVLHTSLLGMTTYEETLRHVFPGVRIPSLSDPEFLETLVTQNYQQYPLYSVTPITLSSRWFWVPEGLLYRLFERNDLPSMDQFIARNQGLWPTYHDPNDGILARFEHLMLSDVRGVYARARIAEGKVLMKAGRYGQAKQSFQAATFYKSDAFGEEAYTSLGLVELYDKNCEAARDAFRQAKLFAIVPEKEVFLYEASAEKMCGNSAAVIQSLYDQYHKRRELEDIPLERE